MPEVKIRLDQILFLLHNATAQRKNLKVTNKKQLTKTVAIKIYCYNYLNAIVLFSAKGNSIIAQPKRGELPLKSFS